MQQLSHTLAKVKRLIIEDEETRALEEVRYTLSHYYSIDQQELLKTSADLFTDRLREQQFQAEELNLLAAFIDELAGLNDDGATRKNLWTKVISIYDILEHEYHVLSFEHIARRDLLSKALGIGGSHSSDEFS